MELLFQQLFNGIMLGSTYSLFALGLTLVYGILNVPNFAHGHMYMLGAYIGLFFMTVVGIAYWQHWPSQLSSWRQPVYSSIGVPTVLKK